MTGFDFNKTIVVYIVHSSLPSGKTFIFAEGQPILWGHNDLFENYTTVYLWHEILHTYLGTSQLEHALIQLIADNELRIQLNGGSYPPFEGHAYLLPLMKKVLPLWNEYLAKTDKNKSIVEFQKFLKEKEIQ